MLKLSLTLTTSTQVSASPLPLLAGLRISPRCIDPKEDLEKENCWSQNPQPEHENAFQY